jgi:DNA-binding MarR family transcriptional regulator
MPKLKDSPSSTAKPGSRRPPFVGALLRLAYQITRQEQLKRLREHGFGDLNQALLNVMVYPHPDGVRPTELADRTNMTRQATNYLLGQLESLGYVERRAKKGSNRRLVFLTKRGWESVDVHRAAVLDVEMRWAKAIGQKRFDAFKETLAELVALETKLEGAARQES